jgi:Tfp pilus assembly protein PilF
MGGEKNGICFYKLDEKKVKKSKLKKKLKTEPSVTLKFKSEGKSEQD